MNDINILLLLLMILVAYLIGCISPSIMLAKAKGIDKKEAVTPERQMHCVSWAKKPVLSH